MLNFCDTDVWAGLFSECGYEKWLHEEISGGFEPINQAKLRGLAVVKFALSYLQNAEAAPGTRMAQGAPVAVPELPQLQAMAWLMPISHFSVANNVDFGYM